MAAATSADLAEERRQASFPVKDMTLVLHGGAQARHERLRRLIEGDPIFSKRDRMFSTHARQYERALEKFHRVQELVKEHGLSGADMATLKMYAEEYSPISLHDVAFIPSLEQMCDAEQQRKWLEPARAHRIIGCYAQTELGHGSNVRGLETLATFDPATQELDLHSPTLTATKWWPGCLGRTATHAIVFARLVTPGPVDNGVHPVMVPIRDEHTHEPLPGVTVGDIGPKMGYNSVDNGFLRLHHVRVPVSNILAKTGHVAADGTYTPPARKNKHAAYSSMVNIRALLVSTASVQLSRATTIAVRYLAVRRQFAPVPEKPEFPVLDYLSVQYRVLPRLAEAYALHFTGANMMRLYRTFLETKNVALIAEVHATSSGLKSFCTSMCAAGIETVRLACGGQGYSALSGLPELYTSYVSVCTAEGDNYLLKQQATRYLLKLYQQVMGGTAVEGCAAYLNGISDGLLDERSAVAAPAHWAEPRAYLAALRHRAAHLLHTTAQTLSEALTTGKSAADAYLAAGWEVVRISDAHCLCAMAEAFDTEIAELARNPDVPVPVLVALRQLAALFALYHLEQNLGDVLESGFVSGDQASMLRSEVRKLLGELRPDAVAMVDAFNHSDKFLNSAIGCEDGRVYERLYEWAQEEPLNKMPAGKHSPLAVAAAKPRLPHSRL